MRKPLLRRLVLFVLAVLLALAAAGSVAGAPNDPLYGVQWGPHQVRAEQA